MKINRRVVFGAALSGLIFVSGYMLRGFLLANFVKPMALLLWMGSRLFASIDQGFYWAGLILALLSITLLRLWSQLAPLEEKRAATENATLQSISRWHTLILLTSGETDRLNFLKNALQKLLIDIYASKQPTQSPWKIFDGLEQGDMNLPASIRKFLMLEPVSNARPTLKQRLQRMRQALIRRGRRWTKRDQAEYYQSIAEVISFMEKQLENEDEH